MITKDNLVGVLETLHYLKTDIGNVYIKNTLFSIVKSRLILMQRK